MPSSAIEMGGTRDDREASSVAQLERIHLPMQMGVWSLSQEDPPEKEMTTHFSILAWEILWTEEPGGPQSTGLQRVTRARATEHAASLLTAPGSLSRSLWKVTSWQAQEPQDGLGPSRKDKFTQTLGTADDIWWQLSDGNYLAPQPRASFRSPISHSSWKVPANSVLNSTRSTSILVALTGMIKPSWLQLDKLANAVSLWLSPTEMGVTEERECYVLVIQLNEYQVLLLLSSFYVMFLNCKLD